MFTGHIEITDKSQSTPFEQYILLDMDNEHRCEAYGIDTDTPMDIDALLAEIFPDDTITTDRAMCGPHNATIITDSRTPDSVVVWQSRDFYFD